jgi:di/tricarboxylate transporter
MMDISILIVLCILAVTVLLLVLDLLRIDVVAILCLLALAWTGVLAPQEALSGFSSNAVVAMIAVMIMGRGVSRTGLMDGFSRAVLKVAGEKRSKIVGLVSVPVGLMSGLIQNIGAVALFLPGVLDIARQRKIAASGLIMPIGFAAILGGTLSMVGSGPLILMNDLLRGAELEPFGLLSVTPVGLVLLTVGIGYFMLFGRFVLPVAQPEGQGLSEQEKLIEALRLPHHIQHYRIPDNSPLQGKTPEQARTWADYRLNVLGLSDGNNVEYAPWRETRYAGGQQLALLGDDADVERFAADYGLLRQEHPAHFVKLGDPGQAGFAEIVIPPRSAIVGQSIRTFSLRKRYAVEPVMVFSRGDGLRGDFSDHQVLTGDTFIVHGLWENIAELKDSPDFVVVTSLTTEKKTPAKALPAATCFVAAIALAFSGAPISVAFLTGAIAMVLLRVLSMQEAYQAIDWKVVFLLAGLIPLGLAMQKSGTADLLAGEVMALVQGTHPIFLILSVAILSTVFSLLISNVGAIVVLAPLVMSMANLGGLDPRGLALMAAVCTANSFILPTHQVNAMLISAGGYRNSDYLKAGSGMTLLFLLAVVTVFYVFYL